MEILPNNTIGISIDDADKSFYEIGWPKFKKKEMPVTLICKYFNYSQK